MNYKLLKIAALHALGLAAYVALVALFMENAQHILGPSPEVLGATVFLLLLVLSVAVVGTLIFLRPAIMFYSGERKDALYLLGYILACLAIILVLIMIALMATSSGITSPGMY